MAITNQKENCPMTYYQRIVQQCKRKDLPEEELCEKLGITKRKLQLLNRYHTFPDYELLDKVAEVLDIDRGILDVDLHY